LAPGDEGAALKNLGCATSGSGGTMRPPRRTTGASSARSRHGPRRLASEIRFLLASSTREASYGRRHARGARQISRIAS
jgi:hypothetical protein